MTESGARFPRRARLLQGREFSRVFKQATRSSDKHLTVLASLNDCNEPRLGLAISKKHLKRAVDRNRVKRIIRESFRCHRSQLPAADFVVMARSGCRDLSNVELFKSLAFHWKRLKKRCAKSP